MADTQPPGVPATDTPVDPPEEDGFMVRVVIETTDAGPDRAQAVAWVTEHAKRLVAPAPFHIEGMYVYAVSNIEVPEGPFND